MMMKWFWKSSLVALPLCKNHGLKVYPLSRLHTWWSPPSGKERSWLTFDGQNSATRRFGILEMWIGKVYQGYPVGGCESTAMPSTTWVKEVFLLHSENSGKTWWEVCTVTWMEETSKVSNKKDRGNCDVKQKNAPFSIFKLPHPAHMTRMLTKCQMHFSPFCGRLLQF